MYWPKLTIDGEDYDLSHLDPFNIDVVPKTPRAPSFRVRISFGCHTFTREREAGDPESHHFEHDTEERCFCPERYRLSHRLRTLLSGTIGKVYFSHDSYLLGYLLDGLAAPYAVVFKVTKAKAPGLGGDGCHNSSRKDRDAENGCSNHLRDIDFKNCGRRLHNQAKGTAHGLDLDKEIAPEEAISRICARNPLPPQSAEPLSGRCRPISLACGDKL